MRPIRTEGRREPEGAGRKEPGRKLAAPGGRWLRLGKVAKGRAASRAAQKRTALATCKQHAATEPYGLRGAARAVDRVSEPP